VDTLHNHSGPQPGTVPSYCELDLRVAWLVAQAVELSFAGRNLLHDHHPEYGFPEPDRPEAERGIYGKATYRW
jgi:iron complex outermembrane receptor protein